METHITIMLYDEVEHEKFGRGIVIPADGANTDSGYPAAYMVRFYRPGVNAKYLSFDGLQAKDLKVVGKPYIYKDKESGVLYRAVRAYGSNAPLVQLEALSGMQGIGVPLHELDSNYQRIVSTEVVAGSVTEKLDSAGILQSLDLVEHVRFGQGIVLPSDRLNRMFNHVEQQLGIKEDVR